MVTYHRVTGGEVAAAAWGRPNETSVRYGASMPPAEADRLGSTRMAWQPYPDPTLNLNLCLAQTASCVGAGGGER